MHAALFVLSTGRCGTQWLAQVLRERCGAAAQVEHEPLDLPRTVRPLLGARDPSQFDPDMAAALLDHAAWIEQVLETRAYVECGHPCWNWLPYLIERFAGRVRVVHLVRHPVPTAWSWIAQGAYCAPLAPHLASKQPLLPSDAGIRFTACRASWPTLNPYERALFYWAEVNAFGLELERDARVPWLRVRFEELFDAGAIERLLAFAGVTARSSADITAPGPIDDYRFLAPFWCDPGLIADHAEVTQVASALGYDVLSFDEASLRGRYLGAPAPIER